MVEELDEWLPGLNDESASVVERLDIHWVDRSPVWLSLDALAVVLVSISRRWSWEVFVEERHSVQRSLKFSSQDQEDKQTSVLPWRGAEKPGIRFSMIKGWPGGGHGGGFSLHDHHMISDWSNQVLTEQWSAVASADIGGLDGKRSVVAILLVLVPLDWKMTRRSLSSRSNETNLEWWSVRGAGV